MAKASEKPAAAKISAAKKGAARASTAKASSKTTAEKKAPAKETAAAKKPIAARRRAAPKAAATDKATLAAEKTAAKQTAATKTPATTRKRAASKAATKEKVASATQETKAKTPAAKAPTKPAESPSAAKIWLKSYPDGLPEEIGRMPYRSLAEMISACSKRFAGRPAFTCMGATLSYAQFDRHAEAFGAFLQSKGLKKGDRVAVMMPNILQYPITIAGILRAGFVVVNVNPLYTARELEHQLKDSGAKAIVVIENFAHTLEKAIAHTDVKHVVVASMGDLMGLKGTLVNFVVRRVKKMVPRWSLPGHTPFRAALSAGAAASLQPVEVGPDDVAFLQYTGGTTGVSKGATLLHRNVLANVIQNDLWLASAFAKRPRPDRLVYVCALPLYHIFGLTVNALMGIMEGGQNILIPNPRDIPGFVKELKKHKFHIFPGLNTLFNALLHNPDFAKLDFSGLLMTLAGGMAVQRPVAERWQAVTGCVISEGYGLSETSPVATANRFDSGEFTGTIGVPLPSTEIAIRDDDGKEVPLGEVGEICIRGPQVMDGYWNRPEETAKVMTADGYFRSGDMGFMDERGYTKIVDRKKDMILVSGFNVYPNEVEEAAAEHPDIVEAAAIGIPSEHSGEAVKLFVVRKTPSLTADDVKVFLAERLTNYKRPREIEFRDELPKSNVGKILRRELRD